MENYFSYCQRFKKNRCNYFQFFKIPLANYNDGGKYVLDEAQKRHCSFKCPRCKMIAFLDFEVAANESAVILLKRQQFVVKLRCQIKNRRARLEERKRNSNSVARINF